MESEEMYKKYAPLLYGMILRLTDDTEIADKILEKSFIKIQQSLPDYRSSACRLFTWMTRITINECKNEINTSAATLKLHLIPMCALNNDHQKPDNTRY